MGLALLVEESKTVTGNRSSLVQIKMRAEARRKNMKLRHTPTKNDIAIANSLYEDTKNEVYLAIENIKNNLD